MASANVRLMIRLSVNTTIFKVKMWFGLEAEIGRTGAGFYIYLRWLGPVLLLH